MNAICTEITVRVIARDGKFLGDDIGGASITIRDAQTKELLAQGITSGGSGPNDAGGVMCVSLRRGEPIPDTGASAFTTFLPLDRPRRIEVTAYGPLGARQSANTVSATQWIYPGKGITGGNGFLLELPGLIVQIVHPPTHYTPASLPSLTIQANVAMMCGCPIDYKTAASKNLICPELKDDQQPWLPEEFEVAALITGQTGAPVLLPLAFRNIPPADTPGQFTGVWNAPPPGTYEITVYAFQKATGNTGVDTATVIVPPPRP
jgi:hypothetical protein